MGPVIRTFIHLPSWRERSGHGTHAARWLRETICVLGLLVLPGTVFSEQGVVVRADPVSSSDGVVALSWTVPEGAIVRIQADRDPGFSHAIDIYRGADAASVVTGLRNGEYRFRGQRLWADGSASQWGPPVTVVVEHHSLARALAFFTVGVVVFLATALLILWGARREEAQA